MNDKINLGRNKDTTQVINKSRDDVDKKLDSDQFSIVNNSRIGYLIHLIDGSHPR